MQGKYKRKNSKNVRKLIGTFSVAVIFTIVAMIFVNAIETKKQKKAADGFIKFMGGTQRLIYLNCSGIFINTIILTMQVFLIKCEFILHMKLLRKLK